MDPTGRFAQMIGGPPSPWTLDLACSLIAASFAHRDRTAEVQAALDDMAAQCAEASMRGVLAVMRGRVRGNVEDYYDPRNSFIDSVLERGVGLPITLGVIAIEIGRRVGAQIVGIGPPGHFLVRDGAQHLFGDPFHAGVIYDRAGLRAAWADLVGAGTPFDDLFLVPLNERAILIRMLNNLRAVYVNRADTAALHSLAMLRGAFVELVHESDQHAQWMSYWN
jgi:regulator of sirC expression with transglutaminase-like and TPR domain